MVFHQLDLRFLKEKCFKLSLPLICLLSGQTNLISGSTDPTDPVFAESRKK